MNKCLDVNEICKLTDEEKEEGKKKPVNNFVEFCTYVYRKPFEKLEEVNFSARQRTEAATQRLEKAQKKVAADLQAKIDALEAVAKAQNTQLQSQFE